MGEREGEREMAGKHPHHDAVLRWWSCDGGEQGSGGAASSRGVGGNGGSGLGFWTRGGGCDLGTRCGGATA
jgi:hypothetical protein